MRLASGREDHLTDRQKYDNYMENVALTLQRKVVKRKKEDEEEKVKANRSQIEAALSNEEREMKLLKEREGQMQLQAEMEERRKLAQAELGGIGVVMGGASKEKVKKAMEDQEWVKALSVVIKVRLDELTMPSQTAKTTHTRTSVQDAPPP